MIRPYQRNGTVHVYRFPFNLEEALQATKGFPGHVINFPYGAPSADQRFAEPLGHRSLDVAPH